MSKRFIREKSKQLRKRWSDHTLFVVCNVNDRLCVCVCRVPQVFDIVATYSWMWSQRSQIHMVSSLLIVSKLQENFQFASWDDEIQKFQIVVKSCVQDIVV